MKIKTDDPDGVPLWVAVLMAEGSTFQIGAPEGALPPSLTDPDCKYGVWVVSPNGRADCKSTTNFWRR